MKSNTLVAVALMAARPAIAQTSTAVAEMPSSPPVSGSQTVQGCFSSKGNLVFNSIPRYNSILGCAHDICLPLGKSVAATMGGNQCFCGDEYPPKSTVVDDTNCNSRCTGYTEICGGNNFWTVYNTGQNISVAYADDDGSVESSSTSTQTTTKPAPTAVVTVSGSVVTVTDAAATASSTPNQPSTGGSSNTAAIAAGAVVGIVAVAGIVGTIFFCLRRRRNQEIADEHRRNAAVNSFISGAKAPSSSGGYSVTDARLDPAVMAQRRYSNGSIADNQDYSRKILRVTNA